MPQPVTLKKLKLNSSMRLKTADLFIIEEWNAKVGSQEILGLTGKFVLGVQTEAGPRLTLLAKSFAVVIVNTLFQQHKRQLYTWTSPYGQC